MAITPTELRKDLYRILDKVLETGEPVEIKRGERTLKIVIENTPDDPLKMVFIKRPSAVVGDFEDIIHMEWSEKYK
ncbi:MAG: type II toxin-antitoxin system Phd/YefM family antitoxin [Deltaproteobacteria bacterium]|nr:type II toxin-antitoxin system Phd/YefM family antitoxin [bacterium]MCB9476863.1 type II toxin-antitoxin system Phd/YefM family antitoxin [Deltaproteobacteria bacterium]MCB9489542.1 type II toxin-antitoxin system Phd/YefM family antitoxin [Deltaproteobacteria bacterium]